MFLGIDVSKNTLDVALLGANAKPQHNICLYRNYKFQRLNLLENRGFVRFYAIFACGISTPEEGFTATASTRYDLKALFGRFS